jgi:hypothetical protein
MTPHAPPHENSDPIPPLWLRTCAASHAVATLATRVDADEDLALTDAAQHLGGAADELQRVRPSVVEASTRPDVTDEPGTLPLPLPLPDARRAIAADLRVALDDIRPGTDTPAEQMLAIGAAVDLIVLAHYALVGRLP